MLVWVVPYLDCSSCYYEADWPEAMTKVFGSREAAEKWMKEASKDKKHADHNINWSAPFEQEVLGLSD